MNTRYQIFVSSTYEDLKEERKYVIQNLLNASYIPTGMEMFSASNDEQFEYIKKILNDCDYYVLIIGGRYGSINPTTGISYTEQEYDYAVEKGIPVLGFVHSNPGDLHESKREDNKKAELERFKQKVQTGRMCRLWNDTTDLASSVIISLNQEISNNPRLGWTRGSKYDSTDLLAQINQLRIEKEELEKKIDELNKEISVNSIKVENLASGDEKYTIKGEKNGRYGRENFTLNITWDEIFSAVGPFLFEANAFSVFESNLERGIKSKYYGSLVTINVDCIQTVKIQLAALGLINIYTSQSKLGYIEFIDLTDKGKNYLIKLKSVKKQDSKENID